MSSSSDSAPPQGDDPSLAGRPSSVAEPGRDSERPEAEPSGSDTTIPLVVIWSLVAIGLGAYLLVQGAVSGAVLVVLGALYVVWLAATVSKQPKVTLAAFFLVAVFCIGWAIVIAAVSHAYHFAVAVGAYGLWALMMSAYTIADVKARRSALLLVAAHCLALLGFLFVDLSWQLDTAVALAAIVLALAAIMSIPADGEAAKSADR
jgi:hypothetical protein